LAKKQFWLKLAKGVILEWIYTVDEAQNGFHRGAVEPHRLLPLQSIH